MTIFVLKLIGFILLCLLVLFLTIVSASVFIHGIYTSIKNKIYEEGTVGSGITLLLSLTVVWLVGYSHVTYMHDYKTSYNKLVKEIVSLDRDTGVRGNFALGCGHIEDIPVYYYYYKVRENTYTLGSLKADGHSIYIVETDEYTPSIYKIKGENKDPEYEYYYNIYVPFNTVVVNYTA